MSERERIEINERGLTRRDFVKGGVATAGALGLGSFLAACGGDDGEEAAAPAGGQTVEEAAPAAGKFTGTIRITGLGVDLIDPIKEAAERDLGFKLSFDVTDGNTMVQKAITQPGSFDIFSGYLHQYDQIWPTGNLQPVDRRKITRWDQVTNLYKLGKLNPGDANCTVGDGDAPFRKMYVDPDKSGTWKSAPVVTPTELDGEMVVWGNDDGSGPAVEEEPIWITGVGANFNMDSLGYNGDVIKIEPTEMSWGELFNPKWRGRAAILNDPGVAHQDAGNAAQALGLMQFGNLGDMTKEEIDALTKILLDLKKQGHFRAFWAAFDESVNLMSSGEVVIESMWSPAVALLRAQGFPVRYAAPIEGFRGWCGGQAISKEVTDPAKLQACYDYFNWWHAGEAGAIMMRQGYYNVVQDTSREFVEPGEYAYWIEGEPADKDYPGPFGEVSVPKGEVRDGGAFTARACKYSSWNSFFGESEYQLQRWNEFLSA